MATEDPRLRQPRPSGPWFRRSPRRAIVLASAMFVGVFGLRLTNASNEDAVSVLYVLPVALLALAFGIRAGLASGAGAAALLAAGVLVMDVALTPVEWAIRIVPLLLLGGLVGLASDQARDAERRQRRYAQAVLMQREAVEINDGIVQGLAVAKWLLESGQTERGVAAVNETMEAAQSLVTRMLRADGPLEPDRLRSRPAASSGS